MRNTQAFRAYRLQLRLGLLKRIKDGSVSDLIERFVKAKVTSELGTSSASQLAAVIGMYDLAN